jgi:hypothetical protein
LVDVYTQEFIAINKTMTSGEKILITTHSGNKTVIGELGGLTYNYYPYRDLDSSWLQLRVGDTLLRYDAESNLDSLEVTIWHSKRLLEVQNT